MFPKTELSIKEKQTQFELMMKEVKRPEMLLKEFERRQVK
jgi:hypothetical protein